MARVTEAVMICLTSDIKSDGKIGVYTEWRAVQPLDAKWAVPTLAANMAKGEHLLFLGYCLSKQVVNTYNSDNHCFELVEKEHYYLEFLRLKTGKPVFIATVHIPILPLHENGRRRLFKYVKKFNLINSQRKIDSPR